MADDEHLGDGVYASHDGYHVWLARNHHENHVIALEPSVMLRLAKYFSRVSGREIVTRPEVSKECELVIRALTLLDKTAHDIHDGDSNWSASEVRSFGTVLADAIYAWSKNVLKESMNIEQLDAINSLVRALEKNQAKRDDDDPQTYEEEMGIKAADDMRDD